MTIPGCCRSDPFMVTFELVITFVNNRKNAGR